MERILIATDFSENATHAAEYGYALAAQLKASIVLCNAFIVPAEMPQAAVSTWPPYDYRELLQDSNDELKELEQKLRKNDKKNGFPPFSERVSEDGSVPDIINTAASKHHAQLVVMGTHGNKGLSGMIMGNHARRMINAANCPLLLVPAGAKSGLVKKVAFATDFKNPQQDLSAIFGLIPTLKKLNAELLITHIYEDSDKAVELKVRIENFLLELSNKANYPQIYYRIVRSAETEEGLDWLCHFGDVDMLAMVHRDKSVLERLFTGSYTQKMANMISVPLLVIPEK